MPELPDRPSLEFLRKLAKERLRALRTDQPDARLADAQFALAREYGFSSWRAFKAEVDRRRGPRLTAFFEACGRGDLIALRALLDQEPSLARERDSQGSTPLHAAGSNAAVAQILLDAGADVNARDVGDNATALHFAAARGDLEVVRRLLDAGADPHGAGDVHQGDVIGWAARPDNRAVVDLLVERGARHHIFSAIAVGDADLVEEVVDRDPSALARRRSRFENGHSPLHEAITPRTPDSRPDLVVLQRLIELGAALEARDDHGRTPMDLAMLRGDRDVIRILDAAGAIKPTLPTQGTSAWRDAAQSVRKSVPMFVVPDMRATVDWYEAVGFAVRSRFEADGQLVFAEIALGEGTFTLSPGQEPGPRQVRLWFYTDRVEDLYRVMKARQLRVAAAVTAGEPATDPAVPFEEDLYSPFYGGRQFSVRDPNGLSLIFWQQD